MATGYDHAVPTAKRQLEPLTYTFRPVLASHASTSAYLVPPDEADLAERPQTFHSNNTLWEYLLRAKQLHHGSRIELEDFFVFEWFPRSPGLYWTPEARSARSKAKSRIIKTVDRMIVYDPHGKQSMLDGGIGNVRLNPITLNGKELVLMCASSTGICHQGFPIACPIEHYQRLIDEIRSRGSVVTTLSGQLKVIPPAINDLYSDYVGVPKLYLEVQKIKKAKRGKSRTIEEMEISVAVSFKGTFEGKSGVFATYVNFDPSDSTDLKRAVSWMNEEYVGSYNGTVLTDFDEQENHFRNATFSLKKVMGFELTNKDFRSINLSEAKVFIERQEITKNTIINAENIGVVGDHASVGMIKQGTRARVRWQWLFQNWSTK